MTYDIDKDTDFHTPNKSYSVNIPLKFLLQLKCFFHLVRLIFLDKHD